MRKSIKPWIDKLLKTLKLYPFLVLNALIGSICFICYLDLDNSWKSSLFTEAFQLNYPNIIIIFYKLSLTCFLGNSLFLALIFMGQRIKKKYGLQILGFVFQILFFWLILPRDCDYNYYHIIVIFMIFLLSHLLVSFVGFLRKNHEINFWEFNKNLFLNLVLTIVFSGVLTGGILLAVLASDHLFNLYLDENYYLYLVVFFTSFGSYLIFLLFLEDGLELLEKPQEYPMILKILVQFILVPLISLYGLILYAYIFKILINWNLPKGYVSYLVIAYSLIGMFSFLLVYPIESLKKHLWVRWFRKVFYSSLLPPLVLQFVAIFTRIQEYGYTENRYFILLIALWISALSLYFIAFEHAKIKVIPISLFLIGLGSVSLPYLNSFSVAKRSQEYRFTEFLKQTKLLVNDKIDFDTEVTMTLKHDFFDWFHYFQERENIDFLLRYLPNKQTKIREDIEAGAKVSHYNYPNLFSNEKVDEVYKSHGLKHDNQDNNHLIISTFGYDYVLGNVSLRDDSFKNDEFIIDFSSKQNVFTLSFKDVNQNKTYVYDFTPFLKETILDYSFNTSSYYTNFKEHKQLNFTLGNHMFKFQLNRVQFVLKKTKINKITSAKGTLLIDKIEP